MIFREGEEHFTRQPKIETEAVICIGSGQLNPQAFLTDLQLPGAQPHTDIKTESSRRFYAFSQKRDGGQIHAAVIFNSGGTRGHIQPKLPLYVPDSEGGYVKFKRKGVTIKVETPPIRFASEYEMRQGITKTLFLQGAEDPRNFRETEEFQKIRLRREYITKKGLILEAAADRIIFPDLVAQKIELEIAPPGIPNPETLDYLLGAKRAVTEQLKNAGITKGERITNSELAIKQTIKNSLKIKPPDSDLKLKAA